MLLQMTWLRTGGGSCSKAGGGNRLGLSGRPGTGAGGPGAGQTGSSINTGADKLKLFPLRNGEGCRQRTPATYEAFEQPEQLMTRAASGATYGVIAVMRPGAGRIRGGVHARRCVLQDIRCYKFFFLFLFFCIFGTSTRKFGEGEIFRIYLFSFFLLLLFFNCLVQATKATFGATYVRIMSLLAATNLQRNLLPVQPDSGNPSIPVLLLISVCCNFPHLAQLFLEIIKLTRAVEAVGALSVPRLDYICKISGGGIDGSRDP